jgi:IS605 OrfB family transposase
MHKSSKIIVNHLVSNNIGTLVIGKNKYWKQDTKMYKKDKQTFIQIPFELFIRMLIYKCKLVGISVVQQEESYTSKASFINQDFIATYGETDDLHHPTGIRSKRGYYKNNNVITPSIKFINADVNGSYNILRKYLTSNEAWNESIYSDCVEVCSTPTVLTVKI